MPVWLTAALTGLGSLAGAIGDWWKGRQAKEHDESVMTGQQTKDALQGESDAIQQVDRVNSALDAGDGGVQHDPNNRNNQNH